MKDEASSAETKLSRTHVPWARLDLTAGPLYRLDLTNAPPWETTAP